MGAGKAVLSLAAGFGSGYLGAKRQAELDEERKADRQMRADEHDLRMKNAAREESGRVALANAVRPATVEEGAGGMIKPDTMDNRDVGLPENATLPNAGLSLGGYRAAGKTFSNRAGADAAAETYNAPQAKQLRMADALDASGKPFEAEDYRGKIAAGARKLAEENAFETARAMRTGDPAAIAAAFNKSGQWKLEGDPVVTPKDVELPGIGKMRTFDVVVNALDPTGKAVKKTVNSHDYSMQLMPYEKALELQRKGTDTDNKHQARVQQLEVAAQKLDLQGKVAEARILRAQAQGGGDKIGREERLRFTTLFSDAGRRMQDSQKALSTLQRDPLFSINARKPGSPEAQQLATLQEELNSHKQERELYQGLLADPKGAKEAAKPSLADARRPSASAEPVKVGSKAERDKLPKGAKYIGPDGQTYIKQ